MTDNWEGKGLYSLHLLFEMNHYIFLKASLAKTWGGHTMCPPPNHPPEWNRVNDKCKTDKRWEGGTKQCCLYLVLEPPVTQVSLPSSQPAHTLMPSRASWNKHVPIKSITQYIHYKHTSYVYTCCHSLKHLSLLRKQHTLWCHHEHCGISKPQKQAR